MKKNTKKIWITVFTVSILVVICALGLLCWHLFGMYTSGKDRIDGLTGDVPSVSGNADTEKSDDKPSSSAGSENTGSDKKASSEQGATSGSTEKKTAINGDINFTELWKTNTDIYAWIKIPNTMIDYPIVQTDGDDGYYLEHSVFKEYASGGSIYTEKINSKDFSDPNTLIYGHNLLNGTMFATLHKFRDPNFFNNNEYIYIYLPDRTLVYRIFAAYEYDDRHIMYSFDFSDKQEYADYLAYATNPVNAMTYNTRDCNVTTDDKIVTLSTCMDANATSRYLVQGVLISDEPVK